MTVDNVAYTAQSPVVSDGATYDVQVALSTFGGSESLFVTSSIAVVSDNVSPGAPTGLAAGAVSGGRLTLSWVAPSAPNYFASQIYTNSINNLSSATLAASVYGTPGASLSSVVSALSGSNYYWVKAVNRSGVGTATASVEVTA